MAFVPIPVGANLEYYQFSKDLQDQISKALGDIADAAFDNLSQVKLLDAAARPSSLSTIARATLGDGGGGSWYWDASYAPLDSDPGADALFIRPNDVAEGAPGRYRRKNQETFNPHWFGALGDGSNNDAPAIQAAIECAAAQGGGVVRLDKATYVLNSSIEIIDDDEHGNAKNITLDGLTEGPSGNTQTTVIWRGAANQPIIKLYSRDCTIKNLRLMADLVAPAKCAIEISKATGTSAGPCTANKVVDCLVYGGMKYGITVGDDVGAGYPTNCENFTFDHVYVDGSLTYNVDGMSLAGYYIPNATGQSRNQLWFRGSISSWRVLIDIVTGDGCVYMTGFGQSHLGVLIHGATERFAVQGCNCELMDRLIIATTTFTGAPMKLSFRDCSFNLATQCACGGVTVTNNSGVPRTFEVFGLQFQASGSGKTYRSTYPFTIANGASTTVSVMADEYGPGSVAGIGDIDTVVGEAGFTCTNAAIVEDGVYAEFREPGPITFDSNTFHDDVLPFKIMAGTVNPAGAYVIDQGNVWPTEDWFKLSSANFECTVVSLASFPFPDAGEYPALRVTASIGTGTDMIKTFEVTRPSVDLETSLSAGVLTSGNVTLKRISVGTADSAGAGYRALKIAN